MNFAIIGVGGYIAPRHLQAIKDVGGKTVMVCDPCDSVGLLDSFGDDIEYYRYERDFWDAVVDASIDYVSICSPNYLHVHHAATALDLGCNVICEKPVALNVEDCRKLVGAEVTTGKKVNVVLQLRLHPEMIRLKEQVDRDSKSRYEINLTYTTPRGPWYFESWKGNPKLSGGLATNIGIHLFDMLIWIFGSVKDVSSVGYPDQIRGNISLEKADVKWVLSIRPGQPLERSMVISGTQWGFTGGFTDLHTKVYEKVLNNEGFGIKDAMPSIELVSKLREARSISATKIREQQCEH